MDRSDYINEKIPLESCISVIVNSFIKSCKGDYKLDIVLSEQLVVIQLCNNTLGLKWDMNQFRDLNNNKCLAALYRVSRYFDIKIKAHDGLYEEFIDLRQINKGFFYFENKVIKNIKVIKFIARKEWINQLFLEFIKQSDSIKRIEYDLKIKFNELLKRHLVINLNDKEVINIDSKELILNPSCNKQEEERILIKKTKNEQREIRLYVNDVRILKPDIFNYISWNKSPYKCIGYTFCGLLIDCYFYKEGFDLNNEESIRRIIKSNLPKIDKELKKNKEHFQSEDININFKMKKIILKPLMNYLGYSKYNNFAEDMLYSISEAVKDGVNILEILKKYNQRK